MCGVLMSWQMTICVSGIMIHRCNVAPNSDTTNANEEASCGSLNHEILPLQNRFILACATPVHGRPTRMIDCYITT